MKFKNELIKLKACQEAIDWVGDRDFPTAWAECERPDWMFWYSDKVKVDRKLIVQAACACARTALRFVPAGEDRPLKAIETAEKWIFGQAPLDEVRAAARAAAGAAWAAAGAARAARAAARAAAGAAAWAAEAAANKDMASIIRKIIKF